MAGLEPGSGALDDLVADGRAIGLRVVLDLTNPQPWPLDPVAPVVEVPEYLAELLVGYEPYGC